MRMVVTSPKASVYGKALRAGDEFECPEKEAKLWAALARAHPMSRNIPRTVELATVDPDTEVVITDASQTGRKRRGRPPGSYDRRDMRADED